MPVIGTPVVADDPTARANREHHLALIERFRALEGRIHARSAAAAEKFAARGKLLPRERLALLLDPGSPFLEISTLAGLGMHDDDGEEQVLGGGIISGIGFISGIRCAINVNDAAIKGGTFAPMGLKKALRLQRIALENRLPLVSLVESGGANLLYQADVFIDGGQLFYNQARLSAAGIPQITVVHGPSTAGGAYTPGLSDYVVMVRNRARVYLAGPPLLKAATGEEAEEEALGGAEMHGRISGVADYLAEDDREGIAVARDIVARLPWPCPGTASPSWDEPLFPTEDLLRLTPADYRIPVDVREIIARIVDGSDFLEFKQDYGPQTICGQAAIMGQPCGIIGNNGPIDGDGANKAAQFIQLCCQSGTPLVFLQNTTGFMVGTEAEQGGIVKHGSKMIQAVSNATVPRITLHIGASFGAGNYGMCGRAFNPRFIFAWPNNRIGVMGARQAAQVMSIIAAEKFARAGQKLDEEAKAALEAPIIAQMEREADALFATARLWDDGLIDPRDSRAVLGFCLATCREGDERPLNPSTFGVARL